MEARTQFLLRHLGPALPIVVLLLAMELTPIDATISGWFYDPAAATFPLRYNSMLEVLGHQWTRLLVIIAAFCVVAMYLLSFLLPILKPQRRLLLFLSLAMTLAPLAVVLLKAASVRHCPWSLQEFGGFAQHLSLFDDAPPGSPPGHCFPSGHASAGFCLFGFYFAGRVLERRGIALLGLWGGLAAGLALGVVRIAQGAHFLSDVLWAGLVCWLVILSVYLALFGRDEQSRPAVANAPAAAGHAEARNQAARWPAVRPASAAVFIPLALIAASWLWQLELRPLIDPDEGRYAEIAREMVATGNWLTPRLNGLLYFEKPPLQYWTTAIAYELFGPHNWTARLWSVLTGLAGILLTIAAGERLFSGRAGWFAGLILASMLLYFGAGQTNSLDMGVSFFMWLAVCSMALGLRAQALPAESRRWVYLAWVSAGLAVLSKGLIGIVLPAGALLAYCIVWPDRSIWRKVHPAAGAALFLLVTAPWFIAVSHANPDFARFFFIHEHFERFLTKEHGRYQPWWFFIAVLAVGVLPWTIPAAAGLWQALKRRADRHFRPDAFLATWVLVVLVFFSLSSSKLVGYIVPVLPAIALLCGRYVGDAQPRTIALQIRATIVVAVAGVILAAASTQFGQRSYPHELLEAKAWWLTAAAVVWLASTTIAFFSARRDRVSRAILALATGSLLANQLALIGYDAVASHRSSQALAAQMRAYVRPGAPVYTVGVYLQGLPFYLGRTVTLVNYLGELQFGFEREPQKGIRDLRDFIARWNAEPGSIAVMHEETQRTLAASGVPMSIIARNLTIVAVRKP